MIGESDGIEVRAPLLPVHSLISYHYPMHRIDTFAERAMNSLLGLVMSRILLLASTMRSAVVGLY